ncbi:hypothetical protein HAX54_004602 [Datura stramonium]|uniref:Uncharacterized protein n=1 Tax=Datura stramonium TaxID=4076 RepID=A0ABS8WVL3_DATST|nr:hypothetical protein [Datura stramonium]
MLPKFQPTKGRSQRRNERPKQTHQLGDEASESKEQVQEIGAKGQTPAIELDEESGNADTKSLAGEIEYMRGDVIKVKTPGFQESVLAGQGLRKIHTGRPHYHMKRTPQEKLY